MNSALIEVATDKAQPGVARVAAVREYFDRRFGKAAQPLKVSDSSDRYDWRKIPIEKARMVGEALRLAGRDGVVIEHE